MEYNLTNTIKSKIFLILCTSFLLLFSFFNASSVSAADTLTISIPDTISLDVLPSASGTFASTSSNITARTTYTHGYTLGIKASSANNNALINTSNSSKTIPSITSSISENDFSSSASYNNKWGIKPSKLNSSSNTNYLPAPTSTSLTVLDKTTAANSTNNSYTIGLGTKVDSTQTPGTYENTFVFTVTANGAPYTINYNANTADTVTNMPSPNPQTGETFATSINIASTVPARNGFNFKGWCTAQVADGATCTGTTYNPNGGGTNLSWAIDQTAATNTLTLYAMWGKEAMLSMGRTVNQKLKRLAGNSTAAYDTEDNTITALTRANSLPADFTPATDNIISTTSSTIPIYAWFDSGTIYYYSEAPTILMNPDSSYLFNNLRTLSDLSTISAWDTSRVTNMSYMLYSVGRSATAFILSLSSWDTSHVKNMSNMFSLIGHDATSFTLDISSWDTSSVTNMSGMFSNTGYKATTFTLNLSSWNTSHATDMSHLFQYAGYSATTWSVGNLSSWDTSNVTNMSYMFYGASYNTTNFTIDLSSWNTSSVTNMSYMFYYAGHSVTSFAPIISSWNTSSVTNMNCMFYRAGYNANSFALDLSSWDTSSVTNMSSMFDSAGYKATTWSVGILSSWNTSNVTDMSSMFHNAGYSITSFVLNLSSWNTSNVTDMSSMFSYSGRNATTWSVGDLSSWNTSNVTSMYWMFSETGRNATTWSVGDLSSWNTSNVKNMSHMFYNSGYSATRFVLNLSSWNTAGVNNMDAMFTNAGLVATTWSVTIPKTNNGTATGGIANTTSNLYCSSTSVTALPHPGESFTLAN